MKMEAIDAYKVYLGIKNHFNTEYDYFKYNKKVNVSYDSFLKRRDKIFFAKLGNRKDKYLEEFLVANLMYNTKIWVGELLSEECEQRYKEWNKRQQSLSYAFKEEIEFMEGWGKNEFNDFFKIENGEHPKVIKKYLRKEISLETLVILDSILTFMKKYDTVISDPIYKEVSNLCKKYLPFLKFDKIAMRQKLMSVLNR
jgi:hypothetical protein